MSAWRVGLAIAALAVLSASPARAGIRPVPAADAAYSDGDYKTAARLWGEACEGGNPTGCYELAIVYRDGEGVAADHKKEAKLLGLACDGAEGRACFNLGLAADPWGKDSPAASPKQQQAATAYYERGCAAGHQESCVNLGGRLVAGRGAPKDVARGVKLLETACYTNDERMGAACYTLSNLYDGHNGAEAGANPALANRYLDLGCALANFDSCINLGYHYRTGYGLKRDMIRSNTLYAMICEDGSEDECPQFTYSEYFSGGGGYRIDNVRPSRRDVAGLYQKACDGGFAHGCVALARLIVRSGKARASEPQIRELLGMALKLDPQHWTAKLLLDYVNTTGLAEMDRRHANDR